MSAPAPRASVLGNELSALTRDDRPRLDQILWSLAGDARRDPHDPLTQAALCHAHALAGEAAALRDGLHPLIPQLAELPHWLRLNLLHLLVAAGDFTIATPVVDTLLARRDLDPDERTNLLDLATGLALRSGNLTLLARTAMASADESAPRRAVQLLHAHALEPWWPLQQDALEAVLRPRTTYFHANLQTDEEYSARIVLDYYTDAASFAALDELQAAVELALERVYADHPDGVAAILDLVVIAVHRPYIPATEPA